LWYPIQTVIKKQWWSLFKMHVSHRRQWWDLGGAKHLQNLHSLSVLRSLFMFSGFKCFFTLVLVVRHNTQFPMALRKTYPINSLWRWIRIKSFLKMLGNMPYHASDDIANVINIKYVIHTILTNAIILVLQEDFLRKINWKAFNILHWPFSTLDTIVSGVWRWFLYLHLCLLKHIKDCFYILSLYLKFILDRYLNLLTPIKHTTWRHILFKDYR
jgi:hypothetical protein